MIEIISMSVCNDPVCWHNDIDSGSIGTVGSGVDALFLLTF